MDRRLAVEASSFPGVGHLLRGRRSLGRQDFDRRGQAGAGGTQTETASASGSRRPAGSSAYPSGSRSTATPTGRRSSPCTVGSSPSRGASAPSSPGSRWGAGYRLELQGYGHTPAVASGDRERPHRDGLPHRRRRSALPSVGDRAPGRWASRRSFQLRWLVAAAWIPLGRHSR